MLFRLYYYLSNEIKDIFIDDNLTIEEKHVYELKLDIYNTIVREINRRAEVEIENLAIKSEKYRKN